MVFLPSLSGARRPLAVQRRQLSAGFCVCARTFEPEAAALLRPRGRAGGAWANRWHCRRSLNEGLMPRDLAEAFPSCQVVGAGEGRLAR